MLSAERFDAQHGDKQCDRAAQQHVGQRRKQRLYAVGDKERCCIAEQTWGYYLAAAHSLCRGVFGVIRAWCREYGSMLTQRAPNHQLTILRRGGLDRSPEVCQSNDASRIQLCRAASPSRATHRDLFELSEG